MKDLTLSCKYNYVIYSVSEDYYLPIFHSLSSLNNVKIFKYAFNSSALIEKLFFLYWSKKINRFIKLPFKSAWYKKMFVHKFPNNNPTCYVFLGPKYILEKTDIYSYIKKLNPDNKCVILFLDILSKRNLDMQKIKSNCDLVVTYDEHEAELFDINYFSMDCYSPLIEVTTPSQFEYDVYFLGYAKDRLKEIHQTYQYFVDKNMKCLFIVCGVNKEDQCYNEGIIYRPPISYRENLINVNKSRCILEIIQGSSVAPTLRMREARIFKRKLITNNTNPSYSARFPKENLFVYNSPENIDISFVNGAINYKAFERTDDFSPLKFIEFLEAKL